jgi:DNA-binding Xre family transcriptional regulator
MTIKNTNQNFNQTGNQTTVNLAQAYPDLNSFMNSKEFTDIHAEQNLLLNLRVRIKQIMTKQKLTQEALAEKMGVNQNQVHRLVAGKSGFTFKTIQKFCIATETKLDFVN